MRTSKVVREKIKTKDADGNEIVTGEKLKSTTKYYYAGDSLVYQCTTETVNNTTQKTELYFFYDSYGNLTLIKYYKNGSLTNYPVLTNSQGDVVAIYSASGELKASYEYDAWGNATITDDSTYKIGTLNPIRYRGYYYDSDLELYYLQSRYYDAEIGRFLNADGTLNGNGDILGFNMFAYCSNNPVMFSDPSGKGFFTDLWNKIETWAKNTFGAGNSTTLTSIEGENSVFSEKSPISVKTGYRKTETISKTGDTSKPVSVYSNREIQNPIKSSTAGININISSFSLDTRIGFDNIGVSGSITNGDITNTFGVKLNLSEFNVVFECSTSFQLDNVTDTYYTNASINGLVILAAYAESKSRQYAPAYYPVPAYGY